MCDNNPIELFTRWFINPIEKLKELPKGDGGFVAMMVAIPLYERYIKAKLKLENIISNEKNINIEIEKDLKLTPDQRKIFWNTFRVGFMHQAMPKSGKTHWRTCSEFKALPEFKIINNQTYICIDPWKFTERVFNKFISDHRLITASDSFPFASIFSIPK